MLDNIQITNFRGIASLHLVSTKRFNLIVGRNNSGKSSILEALFMHCAPLDMRIPFAIMSLRDGGFQPSPEYIVEKFKWLFFRDNTPSKNIFSISSEHNGVPRDTSLALETDAGQASHLPGNISGVSMLLGTITTKFTRGNEPTRTEVLEISTDPKRLTLSPMMKSDVRACWCAPGSFKRPQAGLNEFNEASKAGHQNEIIEAVKLADTDINELKILLAAPNAPELYVGHNILGNAPLGTFGDGIRKIIDIATSTIICKDGVILLDEIEDGIHASALLQFINWLCRIANKYNIQVFATTHSLECIDAFTQSDIDISDLAIYQINRDKAGLRTAKSFTGDMISTIRNNFGLDIRG